MEGWGRDGLSQAVDLISGLAPGHSPSNHPLTPLPVRSASGALKTLPTPTLASGLADQSVAKLTLFVCQQPKQQCALKQFLSLIDCKNLQKNSSNRSARALNQLLKRPL